MSADPTYRCLVAKYPGRCIACDEPIREGDDIAYRQGEVVCRACAEQELPPEFLKGEWK